MALPPGFRPISFDGAEFYVVMASDVQRDGMALELHSVLDSELVAEVFYSDASGVLTAWTSPAGVPADAMTYLLEAAEDRLRPSDE